MIYYRKELFMQIYLSLMSQKNPSSYDLSSPQGRMLYVRETTNAAFSSWTSPCKDRILIRRKKNRKCSPALWEN